MIEAQGEWGIMPLLRGMLGIATVIGIAYAMSYDRKRIDWKLVGGGLFIQIVFALAVLYVPFVSGLLEVCGKIFVKLMDFTEAGLSFLLGPYASKAGGFSFLIHSLPIVIFFSALVSMFYHWGIIQKVVGGIAWLLRKFMNISGAEGLVAAGNIFMGMSESPVLIKNGTVMGTYIGMLGGSDPAAKVLFATHLLSASVMAAPGSIVIAKILCPQTEPATDRIASIENQGRPNSNLLDAISAGTTTGVKLMINIAAMLLVFIALVAFANYILNNLIGHYTGLNNWIADITNGKAQGLTFQFILGLIVSPLMWLIGVPGQDIMLVGSLLGQKTILNEFVAYFQLQQWIDAGLFLSDKSIIMSTYILCGFANISSIGILLGELSVLAPNKREMISRIGIPTMIGGALVSVLSATIVGMILGQ